MPARKRTARRKPTRTTPRRRLQKTWSDTRRALRSAEVTVGKRVAALVKKSGLEPREVMRQAQLWRGRLDREGKKARKRVAARLVQLRQRATHDRRSLSKTVDVAVARALGALNIPTRREVQQLQRRVEELKARVERLR